jgi:hypothetical protein
VKDIAGKHPAFFLNEERSRRRQKGFSFLSAGGANTCAVRRSRIKAMVAFVAVVAVGLLVRRGLKQPGNPVALIRVVDVSGNPIPGAVVQGEGLRTKAGPFSSGWYGWPNPPRGIVTNAPVTTDARGEARIPYPRFVFEKIESGTLCLRVSHSDFVADRPERQVNDSLPQGTPIRERFDDLIARIRNKALLVEPDPIVLKKGGILKISVREAQKGSREWPLFGQVSGNSDSTSNFWARPEAGVIATRHLAEGTQVVSVVQFDQAGAAWFSDAHQVVSKPGVSVQLEVDVKRGGALRGIIDRHVPRPIKNGRVVTQITPSGHLAQDSPPGWHSWAKVNEDGRFEISSLPAGDLEVIALCQGFISTNGPGKTHMRYPQKHVLRTNDLEIEIGMEPTTRLEVTVLDDKGKPLEDAVVGTWPNVRYGEWAATIFASDLYKTEDFLRGIAPAPTMAGWMIGDFSGRSDQAGVAVLPNLPQEVRQFSVQHPTFGLPVTDQGRKEREATVTLRVGVTNYVTVQLERLDQKPITHR